MEWIFDELEKCGDGKNKKIALQFPDQMLSESKKYFFELQTRFPENEFFILADTSYSNCCVDELAADHVNADLIIHFGDSCLSQPSRTRTLWYFQQKELLNSFEEKLNQIDRNTLLFYHINYNNYFTNLKCKNPRIFIGRIFTDSDKFTHKDSLYNRSFDREIPKDYQLLWIGPY